MILQQRHDELNKLLAAVKAYATYEKEVQVALTRLREAWRSVLTSEDKVTMENELNRRLGFHRPHKESYPDLKASENFLQLQRRVCTCSRCGRRRE